MVFNKDIFAMSQLAKKIKKEAKAKTNGVVGAIIISVSNKDTKYIDVKLVSTGLNHVDLDYTLKQSIALLGHSKKLGMKKDDMDVDGYVTIITTRTDPKNIDVKVIPTDLNFGYVEHAIRQALLLSAQDKPSEIH